MEDRTPLDAIVLELAEEVRDELLGVLPDLEPHLAGVEAVLERANAVLLPITWREEEGEEAPEVVEQLLGAMRALNGRLRAVGAYCG